MTLPGMIGQVKLLGTFVLMVLLLGCGPASRSAKSNQAAGPQSATTTSPATTASKQSAEEFAAMMLGLLQQHATLRQQQGPDFTRDTADRLSSQVIARRVSPAFKAVIAEPTLESDQEAGFSLTGFEVWLKSLPAQKYQIVKPPLIETDTVAGYRLTASEPAASGLIRVAKSERGWELDWLSLGGPAYVSLSASSEGSATFAALAFLNAVVTGKPLLAEAWIRPEARARLAPPFASDQSRGFNRGLLQRAIEDFRGMAQGYEISSLQRAGNTVTVSGKLDGKSFTLTLISSDPASRWLVDQFDRK